MPDQRGERAEGQGEEPDQDAVEEHQELRVPAAPEDALAGDEGQGLDRGEDDVEEEEIDRERDRLLRDGVEREIGALQQPDQQRAQQPEADADDDIEFSELPYLIVALVGLSEHINLTVIEFFVAVKSKLTI